MKDRFKQGIVITILAGISWGFSGTCAQILFERFNVTPIYLSSMRMVLAGIILTSFSFFTNREKLISMITSGKAVIRLILFALLGILFNQISYLEAIHNTNSGTATILQYVGPVLCMITECFLVRRLPEKREVIAIILAMFGTFILATHGNINQIYITPIGLMWGLCSAVAIVFYTFLPISLIKEYGAICVTGCAMLIGGIVISTLSGAFLQPFNTEPKFVAIFTAIIILGTVVPYTMYLMGINRCGPVIASMLASVEPVSATLFMIFLLNVPFHKSEGLGFACIFVTVFLLTKKDASRSDISKLGNELD